MIILLISSAAAAEDVWIDFDGQPVSAHRIVLQIDERKAPQLGEEPPLKTDSIAGLTSAVKSLQIVRFQPLFSRYQDFQQLHYKHGLHRYYVLQLAKPANIAGLINTLKRLPDVTDAEPDYQVNAVLTPNDPIYPSQWAHNNTGQAGSSDVGIPDCDTDTDEAWDVTTGEADIIIAILDTGINPHDEYEDRMVPGFDFVGNDYNPTDNNGHGSSCAGIAAAEGNNGSGIAGVSWGSQLMPVKVLDDSGSGSDTDIADGVTFASDNGARVISMSLSGGSFVGYFNSAINYAVDNGTAVFAATGNDNNDVVGYPSRYENCIAVGALSPCNERKHPSSCDGEYWWGSNYGADIDFLSPGVLINTTTNSNGYTSSFNGTSSACPHAAGIGALVMSVNPNLTPHEVRMIMQLTADDLLAPGFDNESGYGRLNAFQAVSYATSHPEAVVEVDALDFQLSGGQTDATTILVINTGEGDLTYEIDPYGYHWQDSDTGMTDYEWIDIAGAGTQLSFSHNDQAAAGVFDLGFNFPFYGEEYSQCIINANGWIGFGSDNDGWQNTSLPSEDGPRPAVLAYWDDLNPSNSGNSSYMSGDVFYAAYNDHFVVWFDDVVHWYGSSETEGTYDFQAVLYADGSIRLNYRDMTGETDLATIGIQNDAGDQALLVAFNEDLVHDEYTIEILPRSEWLELSPLEAVIPTYDAAELNVGVSALNTPDGFYQDSIVLNTNDFANPAITIPVTLTVTGGFCPGWILGDLNQDSELNVMDVIMVVNIVIGDLSNPSECQLWASDINDDGEINVMDIISLVNIIIA